jgi:hypothetical protein
MDKDEIIKKLEEEIIILKEHLKKYTSPLSNKIYYENHKEEHIKKVKEYQLNNREKYINSIKEYKNKTGYKPTPEQKKEYNRQAYLKRKEKQKNEQNKVIENI